MTAGIEAEKTERMLDLRSGWPLLVAFLLVLAVIGWRITAWVEAARWERGEAPGAFITNSFDLGALYGVELHQIAHANLPVDGLKPLDDPVHVPPEEFNATPPHRNFLANGDRVIGVSLGGEACAYQIRQLEWHEIANDVLGGIPIAVTYSPLTDSVRVFDRRIDGEEVEFRFSGLLLNSNLLMYETGGSSQTPSLWSQIEERAISGPAGQRGARLSTFEATLLPFSEWKLLHPDTLVTEGVAQLYKKCYGKSYQDGYLQAGKPMFPVDPVVPADGPPPLTRLLAVRAGDVERVFFYPDIAKGAARDGVWRTQVGATPIEIHYRTLPECAWVAPAPSGAPTAGAPTFRVESGLWFSFFASRRGSVPEAVSPASPKR